MIDKFLKAKHWQLFLLMIGVPIIFQIVMMISIFTSIDSESNIESKIMLNSVLLFTVIMIFFCLIFFGWFWSIGIGLQNKVPKSIKMKVKKFKIFFWTPLIYITSLSIGMSLSFFGVSSSGNSLFPNEIALIIPFIILPLHLFSMFCMFYMLYFVSKTIKTVELQREVKFGEFIGEFIALWFYFIGIWYIQPKVNKLATNKIEDIEEIRISGKI